MSRKPSDLVTFSELRALVSELEDVELTERSGRTLARLLAGKGEKASGYAFLYDAVDVALVRVALRLSAQLKAEGMPQWMGRAVLRWPALRSALECGDDRVLVVDWNETRLVTRDEARRYSVKAALRDVFSARVEQGVERRSTRAWEPEGELAYA